MKFLNVLILILPLSIFAEEVGYQEGDSFKSKKSREVVLYQYKTDASRVNTALTFAFNLGDFMEYAAVDSRDIYNNVNLSSYTNNDTIAIKANKLYEIKLKKQKLLMELKELKNG